MLAAILRGDHPGADESLFPAEGLALFRERLGSTSLLAHGAREWLREPEQPASETELELSASNEATPERVADRISDVVRRVSHLVRRASFVSAQITARQAARGRRAHQMCNVDMCPCRIDFSRRAWAEIRLMGRSTSIRRLE